MSKCWARQAMDWVLEAIDLVVTLAAAAQMCYFLNLNSSCVARLRRDFCSELGLKAQSSRSREFKFKT